MSDQVLGWGFAYVIIGTLISEVIDFAVRRLRRRGMRSRGVLDYTVIDYFRNIILWPAVVIWSVWLTASTLNIGTKSNDRKRIWTETDF